MLRNLQASTRILLKPFFWQYHGILWEDLHEPEVFGCHADPGVYLLLSENGIPYAFASNLDDPRLTVQRGDIADQSYLQSSKSDWTSPQNQRTWRIWVPVTSPASKNIGQTCPQSQRSDVFRPSAGWISTLTSAVLWYPTTTIFYQLQSKNQLSEN